MVMTNSGFLSFEKCQRLVDKSLRYVIRFASSIKEECSADEFIQPIQNLVELNEKVQSSTGKFLSESDIDNAIRGILRAFVNLDPTLSTNLLQFWSAQIEFTDTANSQGSTYNPIECAENDLSRILAANQAYDELVQKINLEPDEKTHLYGLFYIHIALTETVEHSLRKQFEESLKQFDLESKYDVEQIFSIEKKIPKNSKIMTDVRAIRDALSHFKYEIVEKQGIVLINFNNQDKGYDFIKKFTKDEYQLFVQKFVILYKIQIYLIWLSVANLTLYSAFKI